MSNESKFIPNFLQVPNAVIDELLPDLTGAELKCYLVVIRKTKGWNKESDNISISQFMKATGLSNSAVIKACESLVKYGLLIKKNGARNTGVYAVNSYSKTTCEESSPVKKVHSTCEESSQVTCEKSSHTKNNIKNTTQNNNSSSSGKDSPTEENGKKKFVYTDDDMRAANWIFELIKNLSPNAKTPSFANWANEIRLMRERDNRTHKEICELFRWANQDQFWATNILSPSKLREKWDQLEIKRKSSIAIKRKESFEEKNSSDWASPEKMMGAF